jgi:hypothetical protein
MLNLLQLLIVGHVHKWKEYGHSEIVRKDNSVMGIISFCRCEVCGEQRSFKMTVYD